MTDPENRYPGREARQWWVVDKANRSVGQYWGYVCNDDKSMWWIPKIGITATVGYQLYADKTEAYREIINFCAELRNQIDAQLDALYKDYEQA